METPEALTEKLRELCAHGARDQLIAKGLARGMIWEEGELPEGSPNFSSLLTNDLLNHGYLVLGAVIRLRMIAATESIPDSSVLDDGFRTAAECIEAAVRRGVQRADRGFHLTVAAAAFHLAHYGARSFSLLSEHADALNLAHVEKILVALIQRRLDELQVMCRDWLSEEQHTDSGIAQSLREDDDGVDATDAAYTAIARVFHCAIARFEFALRTGLSEYVDSAIVMLERCVNAANELKHVPLWWISVLARHLIDDLWQRSLHQTLPVSPSDGSRWPELRNNFIDLLTRRSIAEIDLWPSQLDAALRVLDETDSLVVALPTSSGKTRIAELCILRCLAGGRRVVYVTPLRALSAQVENGLSRTFKPLGFSVSSVYGASGIGASDVDTMRSADIVVATPEKLDFAVRQDADVIDDVALIVLDEGHMIGLSEREIRYEVLVQRLLQRSDAANRRIVCLSAIFTEGEAFDAFTDWIRSDEDGKAIRSQWRPTRQRPATLEWKSTVGWLEYRVEGETVFIPRFVERLPPHGRRKNAFPQNQQELIAATIKRFHSAGHSVLVYCPIRRSVEPTAKSLLKLHNQGYLESFLADGAEDEIALALRIGEEWLGEDHVAIRALRVGVAVHHGQLPRPFLAELERLLRKRVLTIAVSSPTLAQGVDLSFGVLVFTSLWRNQKLIPPKEFANVIGRVGRAFVDLDGIYVLPVFESNASKRKTRLREFHNLVKAARGRELESGLFLLIFVCLWRLKEHLQIDGDSLADYVLNQQECVDAIAAGDDLNAQQMEVILAELDAGILSLVEDLDCNATEVASILDDALQNSLWKRRLAVRELDVQAQQTALLHGRAQHIWVRTTSSQRQGFFSASIGIESGLQIVEERDEFRRLLDLATSAIETGNTDQLVDACCNLAELLFTIHPFRPSIPGNWDDDDWRDVLGAWIIGTALYGVTDSIGIAFVQEALVFRLVWGIEAVRLVLSSLDSDPNGGDDDDERTFVAICMTYGVPSIAAATMLEFGMESRLLAVRLTTELSLKFTTREELLLWIESVRKEEPISFTDFEREAWQHFLSRSDPEYKTWQRTSEDYTLELTADFDLSEPVGVRLIPGHDGQGEVFTSDFDRIGTVNKKLPMDRVLTGIAHSTGEICINTFGPIEPPDWLKEFLAGP